MRAIFGKTRPPLADDLGAPPLPVVWLLGKTGAGKTSLLRALTGLEDAAIGNGFAPCTRTSAQFDFPAETPLVRFLDTRGLGEAGYDPSEDLAACEGRSHEVFVVARLDDPVQGEVAEALSAVVARRRDIGVTLVHTGRDLVPDPEARNRAAAVTRARFEAAAGHALPEVIVALDPSEDAAEEVAPLLDRLADTMPAVATLLARGEIRDDEQARFAEVRARVLSYASAAGASDIAPVVGAISVPGVQIAMLRMLGQNYGVAWTRSVMGSFSGALGMGVVARFGASYGLRQLGKLLPGYGQTIGAAAAGTISFATTFALGRAAAFYLYQKQGSHEVVQEDLRAVYRNAFRKARHAPD